MRIESPRRVAIPVPESDPVPPAVSVVIPAYNSARSIARCLGALCAQQTTARFEIVLVHSGTDRTAELARAACPQVRVIELAERAIAARARNVGAAAARGSVLAFVDADAYAAPDWIANVVASAATGSDLVCGAIDNANPGSAVSRAEQLLMFNEFLADSPEGPLWFSLSGNMVLPRRAYERFGPFAEVRAAEDIVFSRRLKAAGGSILFRPAMRVAHDNRTRVRPFLRNQFLIGKHTAIARRLVHFPDTAAYPVFLLMLPVSPAAKLLKIAARLARRNRRALGRLLRELPLVLVGTMVYCSGLVAGVLSAVPAEAAVARVADGGGWDIRRTGAGT